MLTIHLSIIFLIVIVILAIIGLLQDNNEKHYILDLFLVLFAILETITITLM